MRPLSFPDLKTGPVRDTPRFVVTNLHLRQGKPQ